MDCCLLQLLLNNNKIYHSGVQLPFQPFIGSLVGGPEARDRVFLRECIWNVPTVACHPTFDNTASLGSPPRQVVSPPV